MYPIVMKTDAGWRPAAKPRVSPPSSGLGDYAKLAALLPLLVGFALGAPGCTRGSPDDVLLLSGVVDDPRGAVILERRLGGYCSFSERFEELEPWEQLAIASPDASGTYLFEVYRATAHPSDALTACFRIRDEGHARSELRTSLSHTDARLPVLSRWDSAPSFEDGAWAALEAPTLPEGSLVSAHLYEWQLDAAGAPAWRRDTLEPWSPDPALLEDFAGTTLSLTARAEYLDYDDSMGALWATYTSAHLEARSPEVSLTAGGLVPLTRDGACLVQNVPLDPCTLVDGSLEAVTFGAWDEPPIEVIELRWEESRPVRRLIVRGLESSPAPPFTVELAEGDGPWETVFEQPVVPFDLETSSLQALRTPGLWLDLALDEEGVRSADRLRFTSHAGIYGARELSVFE